jgi:signal transduction histidine kinase
VIFEVTDTGPGIPAEQVSHLFEQFWQARKSDKRGVGLGLTIAKGIVDAHGGRIWVNSTPGAGTTFLFSIPAGDGA